jgi:uncharacterized protein (TIGR02996 family)
MQGQTAMTEDQRSLLLSLLGAIRDHPDDAAPRLVLADWLQENGRTAAERARGELIALEARLAALTVDDLTRVDLEDQAHRLQMEHAAEWLGPWYGHVQDWEIENGLLRLEVEWLDWLGDEFEDEEPWLWLQHLRIVEANLEDVQRLQQLPHVRHLRSLDLKAAEGDIGPEAVRILAECPHFASLTALRIDDAEPSREGIEALLSSPHLTRLTTLGLLGCAIRNEDVGLLARWPLLAKVKELELQFNDITDAGVAALAGSSHLSSLVELDLSENGYLHAAGIAALARSPKLPRLHSLDLGYCHFGNDGARELARLGERGNLLTTLNVKAASMDAKGTRSVVCSPNMARLISLTLDQNNLGDDGAVFLAGSPFLGCLTSLNLWGCGIGEEGVRRLAAAKWLAGLKSLALTCDAAGAAVVASAANLAGLRSLKLGDIGNEGVQALVASSTLSGLRELTLYVPSLRPEDATALARWPLLRGVNRLKLQWEPVDHASPRNITPVVEALLASPYLGNLRELALEWDGPGTEVALAIAAADSLPRLRNVALTCGHISDEGRQALAKRFGWAGK